MSRLPLPADLCRCLGHEKSAEREAPTIKGKGCKKAESCARHQTIGWDRFDGTLFVTDHLCARKDKEYFIAAYVEGQP